MNVSADPHVNARWAFASRLGMNALALFPIVFAVAFYGEYLLAWIHLGHAPVPSLNDPKGIHPWLHVAVAILFICMPSAALLNLAASATFPFLKIEPRPRTALRALGSSALYALVFFVLYRDPYDVGIWWID